MSALHDPQPMDAVPAPHPSQPSAPTEPSVTALDYINHQLELEKEAREILPYSFETCTYSMGPLRQPVYACPTHSPGAALCYSCSISCHPTCTLVELFTKRNIQCDCGTTRVPNVPCTLRSNATNEEPCKGNKYCHNYQGRFCACDKDYDINKETGTMYQCYLGDACNEDWFHDKCIVGLPPGFPAPSTFTHFICWLCVQKNPWLRNYAGTPGFLPAVIKRDLVSKEDYEKADALLAQPRILPEPSVLEPEIKPQPSSSEDINTPLSPAHQPSSPTSSRAPSILDMGERALSTMDRVKAIEGVMAYNHIKEKVKDFLAPFAKEGKEVGAEDVRRYFEKLRGDGWGGVNG
ncbi:hypothetical protein BDZ91DRAFT_680431, partial [Kalaharituber pfeilii]